MSVFDTLARWGIDPQQRSIRIYFSDALLNTQVFLQRIDGQHAINQGLSASLLCLSANANIALKQFIGARVCITQRTDHGQWHRTSGIITQATLGKSDGALTAYTLELQDPTALLKQRRNSRVFMNKSVVDISRILFEEWQANSQLFSGSLSLDLQGLKPDYDIRPFVIQSNESDYKFLTRLWRSEGINWLIDETSYLNADSGAIEPQILRLIDENRHFKVLTRQYIIYQPSNQQHSNSVQQFDHITQLITQHSLQPNAVSIQHWHPQQHDTQSQGVSNTADLTLEQAWSLGSAWVADLNGEDGATAADNDQLEKLQRNISDHHNAQAKFLNAITNVRDSQVGYWFSLNDVSTSNSLSKIVTSTTGEKSEFLITAKQFYHQNNLPKELQQQVNQLLTPPQLIAHSQQTQHASLHGGQLTLAYRDTSIKPAYHPLQHRPSAQPQRARVVGPQGDSIYVDAWGRIKVQFLFARTADHQHAGGAGSSGTESDSGWVDVITPWAGDGAGTDANYGARFLPRIGELVVIDFLDGNIDRPFVVGRLHEGSRMPAQFDQIGTLPDTRALSGIKSQEINGSGFNQLRFDDSTGQISAQLNSSHAASQLNLGHLSHPKQTDTSKGRGEGFELRTDQFGAVRAGQGLLISTHAQQQAQGHHLHAQPAKQQLENSLNSSSALSDVAKNQQTDPLDVLNRLKHFIEQIEQQDESKASAFKSALMILSAPDSIALSSQQDIHLSAAQQISQTAGGSINLSTQNNLIAQASDKISLFAAQKGISAIAAKGKIQIQAQDDALELIARKVIQIISTEDNIALTSAKEIILTAGGSQIKINGSGVLITTGGKFESKAAQHVFSAGERAIMSKISLPMVPTLFSNKINYVWKNDSKNEKEILILDKENNKLIKNKADKTNDNNMMSSLRFYTPQQTDFMALAFNSTHVQIKQKLYDSENKDELLEEALFEEEADEVYAEEDKN